jgi:hypothetical protein
MIFDLSVDTPTLDAKTSDKRIVCFGAGRNAERFLSGNPRFVDRVRFFIDNNTGIKSFSVGRDEFPVKPFADGCGELTDSDVIVVTPGVRCWMAMVAQLSSLGLRDSISCFALVAVELRDIIGGIRLDYDMTSIVEYIASRESSSFGAVRGGAEEATVIEKQLSELDRKVRGFYADDLMKSDPKLFGILDGMHDTLCDAIVSCKYLLVMDTVNSYHHGCSANSMAVRLKLLERGSVFSVGYGQYALGPAVFPKNTDEFESPGFADKWAAANEKLVSRIMACEHVVASVESLLGSFSQRSVNLCYLLYYAKTVLDRKVSVINHSVYPISLESSRCGVVDGCYTDMLRLLYAHTDNCCLRESASYREFEVFMPSVAKQTFDCVPLYIAAMYPLYGITPVERGYILVAGGFFLAEWYPAFLCELMKDARLRSLPVVFLYSDLPYANREANHDELDIYRCLKAEFGGRVSLRAVKSTDEWLRQIHFASLLVSGRYHHSIAAFMLDTPFMSFRTDSQKMTGMLDMIGKRNRLLPDGDISSALDCAGMFLDAPDFAEPNSAERKGDLLQLAGRNLDSL